MQSKWLMAIALFGLLVANLLTTIGVVVNLAPLMVGGPWPRLRIEVADAVCLAQFTLLALWVTFGGGSVIQRLLLAGAVAALLLGAIRFGIVIARLPNTAPVMKIAGVLLLPPVLATWLLLPLRRLRGWHWAWRPVAELAIPSMRFRMIDLIVWTALLAITLGGLHSLSGGDVLSELMKGTKDLAAILPIAVPTMIVALDPRYHWIAPIALFPYVIALAGIEVGLPMVIFVLMSPNALPTAYYFGLVCLGYNLSAFVVLWLNLFVLRWLGLYLVRPGTAHLFPARPRTG